jgi:hypothetical protein
MTSIRPSISVKPLQNEKNTTEKPVRKDLNPLAPQKESLDRVLYRVDLSPYDVGFKGGITIKDFEKLGNTYGFKTTENKDDDWAEDANIVKNDQSVIETERLGIQGGNILSVGDKNGKVKHLVGEGELSRVLGEGGGAYKVSSDKDSFKNLSKEKKKEAIEKMAKLLNVEPEAIVPIPQSKGRYIHIDGEISGLEDGKVAMNHPKVMLEALEKVDRNKLSRANRIILDEHIKATKENLKKYGKEYDKTVEILKKEGLDVALVPGYSNVEISKSNFKTNPVSKALYEEYSKIPIPDKEDAEEYARIYPSIEEARYYWHMRYTAETQISFNNGILGKTKKGKGYMITNGSKAFKDLEEAFSKSIKSQSKALQDVNFVENNVMTFGNGGIQCLTNEYADPSFL